MKAIDQSVCHNRNKRGEEKKKGKWRGGPTKTSERVGKTGLSCKRCL